LPHLCLIQACVLFWSGALFAGDTTQYIVFNRAPGQGMYQGQPESLGRAAFDELLAQFSNDPNKRVQTDIRHIFSVFRTPPETTVKALRVFLEAAKQTSTPVVVQIDSEHWWDALPDLWNWWDSKKRLCFRESRERRTSR
jgi:hypothetical protein